MGLLLLSSGIEAEPAPEPEAEFVRARPGRTVRHGYGGKRFAPKDPDEVDWINFDFSLSLAQVGDSIDSIDAIELDEDPDSAMTLDLFAHEDGVVSARWQGGTSGSHYVPRCRITTVAGRTWDLSGTVFIAAH